jgi:type IV pilus assembly protein PilN
MRFDINLASHKYQDAREFYVRWGTALVLVMAITVGLAWMAWSSYKTTARNTKDIRALREKIAQVDQERQQAEAVLNRPENRDVREQSQFWNDVIDQKSFSWTQLLSDLEKIMPARAYVVSAAPEITPERQLLLKLSFVGEQFDNANELVEKMEHSERFHLPRIQAAAPRKQETTGQGSAAFNSATPGSAGWQFDILTYYTPAAPAAPPARTQVSEEKRAHR